MRYATCRSRECFCTYLTLGWRCETAIERSASAAWGREVGTVQGGLSPLYQMVIIIIGFVDAFHSPVDAMQDRGPSGHIGDWVPAGCAVNGW